MYAYMLDIFNSSMASSSYDNLVKVTIGHHDHFLADPAFRPKMSLCHRVASVVCCLSSVHNSQEMLLLPQFLFDFNSVWFV